MLIGWTLIYIFKMATKNNTILLRRIGALLIFLCISVWASAQQPIVSYMLAKESPTSKEFLVVWESSDYKSTLHNLESILKADNRILSEQYLWKVHQISVTTAPSMTNEAFGAIFRNQGYEVREKKRPQVSEKVSSSQ